MIGSRPAVPLQEIQFYTLNPNSTSNKPLKSELFKSEFEYVHSSTVFMIKPRCTFYPFLTNIYLFYSFIKKAICVKLSYTQYSRYPFYFLSLFNTFIYFIHLSKKLLVCYYLSPGSPSHLISHLTKPAYPSLGTSSPSSPQRVFFCWRTSSSHGCRTQRKTLELLRLLSIASTIPSSTSSGTSTPRSFALQAEPTAA